MTWVEISTALIRALFRVPRYKFRVTRHSCSILKSVVLFRSEISRIAILRLDGMFDNSVLCATREQNVKGDILARNETEIHSWILI